MTTGHFADLLPERGRNDTWEGPERIKPRPLRTNCGLGQARGVGSPESVSAAEVYSVLPRCVRP